MKKQDIPIIVLLVGLLVAWPIISKKLFPPAPPQPQPPDIEKVEPALLPDERGPVPQTDEPAPALPEPDKVDPLPAEPGEPPSHSGANPDLVEFGNSVVSLTFSSWGGGIVSAVLHEYPQTTEPESAPLQMDFSKHQSLTYSSLPGLTTNHDFEVTRQGDSLVINAVSDAGVSFNRVVTFSGEGYELRVVDTISNVGGAPIQLPDYGLHLGPMQKIATSARGRAAGISYLGVDYALSHGGKGTQHTGKKMPAQFRDAYSKSFMCSGGSAIRRPDIVKTQEVDDETDWLAVKNKFFVQLLAPIAPGNFASSLSIYAERAVSDQELEDPDNATAWPSSVIVSEAYATAEFRGQALAPGESFSREMRYYLGPKLYSALKAMGKGDVMEFGWSGGFFGWFGALIGGLCPALLWLLNALYSMIPNYGVAIILLTLLIRIVFWPIMQKSTDNMKKMQEIQPQLKELKEKFGSDHQKFIKKQQELFKEHKVSPVGGCLPMLIQIPVFIALFTVLRSAVELRFAGFLWIGDLSEPEGLLSGVMPAPIYELNILPILMTVTMIWQQRLTPSGGDPQQQKMMAIMMPVLMLVLFYGMASALVLYWTFSQCLGIVQLLLKNRKDQRKAEAASAG